MAGFEDLIRSALEKHGDPTHERRATIYQSSRQALERMLDRNRGLDENAITAQRRRLESAIANIEAGYSNQTVAAPVTLSPARAHVLTETEMPTEVQVSNAGSERVASEPPPPVQHGRRVEPGFGADRRQAAVVSPVSSPIDTPQVAAEPTPDVLPVPPQTRELELDYKPAGPEEHPQTYPLEVVRERRPYAQMLLWTVIVVGIGVAVWWGINFGPSMIQQQLGGSVPNPGQTIESGSFVPKQEEGWISAFNPSEDGANIDSGDRGTADIFQEGTRNFVRLASNVGSSRNNLRIKIPRGVILPLKGEAATFEVLVRSSAETSHQFAVFCEFGEMGNCGRKRFTADGKVEAYLFDVLINDVGLAESEDAFLSFNTDLGGDGKGLDLYAIRVRMSR